MDNLLTNLLSAPAFAHRLLDRVVEVNTRIARKEYPGQWKLLPWRVAGVPVSTVVKILSNEEATGNANIRIAGVSDRHNTHTWVGGFFARNDVNLYRLNFYVWIVRGNGLIGLIDTGLPIDNTERQRIIDVCREVDPQCVFADVVPLDHLYERCSLKPN